MAKTACGAMDIVPLISVTNLVAAIEDLKKAGYWVWGLDGDARQTIREAKPDQKTALVLGAEGKGLRRLSAEHCDLMVRLPIHEQMESLNVSNAAAIAMYEIALTSKNS
jgi:23S rRNA (guanosine2251-2'-O)-methyltransferase